MPYTLPPANRIAWDIDGTVVGYGSRTYSGLSGPDFSNGVTKWLTAAEMGELDDETLVDASYYGYGSNNLWFFFPEKREIDGFLMCVNNVSGYSPIISIQGSNDTTNGMDGNWEVATLPSGSPLVPGVPNTYNWRDNIKSISFSEPKKVLRVGIFASNGGYIKYETVHIYGKKYATETPDDIIILNNELDPASEFQSVKDWGDRPEGTTIINSVRLQNVSAAKQANNVNLQLNQADFAISFDPAGPWGTVLDIASLAPNAQSSPIYIRNQIGAPNQTLGPKAARLIVTVGSWA